MYTKADRLPDWVNEFAKMQYLHFEGDFSMTGLSYAPKHTFTGMNDICFIHMGGIQGLREFPSLAGLTKLTCLTMAILDSLIELPNLDDLENLEELDIVEAFHVKRLPPLTGLRSLKSIMIIYRNEMCCNGYLDGVCDLNGYKCASRAGEPLVECLNDTLSAQDKPVVSKARTSFVCTKNLTYDISMFAPSEFTRAGLCGGVKYKQCHLGFTTGMCYNGRFQVVYCDGSGDYERIRRLQIARGVGPQCDLQIEAWLDCQG